MADAYPLLCRGVLITVALVVLAWIGRASAQPTAATSVPAADAGEEAPAPSMSVAAPAQTAVPSSTVANSKPATSGTRSTRASADDPVYLNVATLEDLRRLPGVGGKRAELVLQLRAKIGRFHQLEDLRRIRGFGRATLKRLRPLVRLDPPPDTSNRDAGTDAPMTH